MSDDSAVAQFVGMTGTNASTAQSYLEASGGDINAAMNLYLEGGGAPPMKKSSSSTGRKPADTDSVRAPIAPKRARLYGGDLGPSSSLHSHHNRPQRSVHNAFRDFAAETRSAARGTQQRGHDRTLSKLYEPPRHLIFGGSFAEARATGRSGNRWILVSILDSREFASYVMNRDLWAHETVQSVIEQSFILFQHDKEDGLGQQFIAQYRPPEPFPYVCVIDPNTGERMITISVKGKFESDLRSSFLDEIHAFLAVHKLGGSGVVVPSQPPRAPIIDCTEDEQLAAAIAASLTETSMPVDDIDEEYESEGDGVVVLGSMKDENEEVVESPEPLVDEPETDHPNATTIQFRLPGNNRIKRRFDKSKTISELYAFVATQCTCDFEIEMSYPRRALVNRHRTLEDEGVGGCTLIVKEIK